MMNQPWLHKYLFKINTFPKYSQVTANQEGSRPLMTKSSTVITGFRFLLKLYNFTPEPWFPSVGVCKAHTTSTEEV